MGGIGVERRSGFAVECTSGLAPYKVIASIRDQLFKISGWGVLDEVAVSVEKLVVDSGEMK